MEPLPIYQEPLIPLSMVGRGETVTIRRIDGGRIRQRLFDLGLNVGSSVRVVKNETPGPMILAVKGDSRLAIGRGMCVRILVAPTSNDNQTIHLGTIK